MNKEVSSKGECPKCKGDGLGEWGGNGILFFFEECAMCNGDGKILGEIDPDIIDLVNALNIGGVTTISSCCGHGRELGHIALKDGRWLVILPKETTKDEVYQMVNSTRRGNGR